jgi:hypothetical protein
MKEFMLIFSGPDYSHHLSPDQSQAQFGKWYAWVEDLKKKGLYKEGRPLLPTGGKTVKGKQPVVTDGPFAESKEIVGGYFIIEVASMEEAVAIAKHCPDFELEGQVEIREVMKM